MSYLRAAYHEAAHCVARARCGRELITVEIRADGGGLTHGDGQVWLHRGQYEVWDYVTYCLAGMYAEARKAHVSAFAAMLTGGRDDEAAAGVAIDWLVSHGYAESELEAWRRAEWETRQFVRDEWPVIERLAAALVRQGRLDVDELTAIVFGR